MAVKGLKRGIFFAPIPLQTSCKGVLAALEQFQNFIFSSLRKPLSFSHPVVSLPCLNLID